MSYTGTKTHTWFLICTTTLYTQSSINHTHPVAQTHAQCGWVTIKGLRLKITTYYFVCTVARLPGSPEVAVIDLSNPSFQHVILSPLLLSGVCQRDRAATQKILAATSKLTSGQNSAAVMNTATLPASARVLISQMSSSAAHNNEYLMRLSLFKTFLSPHTHSKVWLDSSCVLNIFSPFHYGDAPWRVQQLTCLRPYLTMFFFLFLFEESTYCYRVVKREELLLVSRVTEVQYMSRMDNVK